MRAPVNAPRQERETKNQQVERMIFTGAIVGGAFIIAAIAQEASEDDDKNPPF